MEHDRRLVMQEALVPLIGHELRDDHGNYVVAQLRFHLVDVVDDGAYIPAWRRAMFLKK
jgi:hypothetical protein